MKEKQSPRSVAVIGSGMAGLVTAYLLHHDPLQRYQVRLLEKVCPYTNVDLWPPKKHTNMYIT